MHPDLLDRESAEKLVDAITGIDGVAALNGGRYGEVAMLFPGTRVRGIHVTTPRDNSQSQRLEVNVVADGEKLPNLDKLATAVREVAQGYVSIPVDVHIVDVA